MSIRHPNIPPRAYHITREQLFDGLKSGVMVLRKHYYQSSEILHYHDFYELVIVLSGSASHITENAEYPVGRGDVFLLRPGERHSYRDIDAFEIVNIIYSERTASLLREESMSHPGYLSFFEGVVPASTFSERSRSRFSELDLQAVLTHVDAIEAEGHAESPESAVILLAHFMLIAVRILRSRAWLLPACDGAGKLREVLNDIHRNGLNRLSVADIANHASLSPRTLQRLFREHLGKTPEAYLNDFRLDTFLSLLLESGGKIYELAEQCGFSNAAHLCRRFRQRYGCSPRQWGTGGAVKDLKRSASLRRPAL